MRTIRHHVFETNSSSMHSVIIMNPQEQAILDNQEGFFNTSDFYTIESYLKKQLEEFDKYSDAAKDKEISAKVHALTVQECKDFFKKTQKYLNKNYTTDNEFWADVSFDPTETDLLIREFIFNGDEGYWSFDTINDYIEVETASKDGYMAVSFYAEDGSW